MLDGRLLHYRRDIIVEPRDLVEQRAELKLLEFGHDGIVVEVRDVGGGHVERDRSIVANRRQILAHEGVVAVVEQLLLGAGGLDLVDVLVDLLDRAVLIEQLDGADLTHALDAGNVVRLVADQRLEVDDLDGLNLVAGAHSRRAVVGGVLALVRVVEVDRDVVGDELKDVAVQRADPGVETVGNGLIGERTEYVVGLETGFLVDRHRERLGDLAATFDLGGQILRHRFAVGLVVRVDVAAEHGGIVDVEGEGRVRRLERAEDVQERRGEAPDSAGRFAGGGAQIRTLHGEICAEDQSVGVENDDPFALLRRLIVSFSERRHPRLLL